MERNDEAFCPLFHHAVELIGRRWVGAILRVMLHGVTRFGEIRDLIPGLSDKMLAERLQELQREGIIERHVHDSTPVRIDYTLTEKGRELQGAVEALSDWAEEWDHPNTINLGPVKE